MPLDRIESNPSKQCRVPVYAFLPPESDDDDAKYEGILWPSCRVRAVPASPGLPNLDENGWVRSLLSLFVRKPFRPGPEACNRHLAQLPTRITDKLAFHIADPFDRVALAMTCRLMEIRLASYKEEFALFRLIIAERQGLEHRSTPQRNRGIFSIRSLFTAISGTSSRAFAALDRIFRKLDQLYPRIPERAFFEVWPLFGMLDTGDATDLLNCIVPRAARRSPSWAIDVLREVAYRWRFRKHCYIKNALLQLALPFWRDPSTAREADDVIGYIVRNVRKEYDPCDRTQWLTILELLPPGSTASSKTVLGLASAALRCQYMWEKYPTSAMPFSALNMLGARIGELPSRDEVNRFSYLPADPELHVKETEIALRRNKRYQASRP